MVKNGQSFVVDYASATSEVLMRAVVFTQRQSDNVFCWFDVFETFATYLGLGHVPLAPLVTESAENENPKFHITLTRPETLHEGSASFWTNATSTTSATVRRESTDPPIEWMSFGLRQGRTRVSFYVSHSGVWTAASEGSTRSRSETTRLERFSEVVTFEQVRMQQTLLQSYEEDTEHQESTPGLEGPIDAEVKAMERDDWKAPCSYLAMVEIHDYRIWLRQRR
ncbi:hypothetical protein LTR78_004678 [Recurvomyces mirabilis]|uniref:Uncharacterized protein n=1 Tax=Recurvomyces mirabilis TaxID=574656 RepID=A0AAE1C2G6_9PEZI|nr:hypothetical protein LTR78_004678 [Recurvomyces mirabilis]KAK5152829.1 hypothetical protein LTS14_007936 [Recurvomyces mirabilis]